MDVTKNNHNKSVQKFSHDLTKIIGVTLEVDESNN